MTDVHEANGTDHPDTDPKAVARAEREAADQRRRQLSVELPQRNTKLDQLPADDRAVLLTIAEQLAVKVSPIHRADARAAITTLLELTDDDAKVVANVVSRLLGLQPSRRQKVRDLLREILDLHGGNTDHDQILRAWVAYARETSGITKRSRR